MLRLLTRSIPRHGGGGCVRPHFPHIKHKFFALRTIQRKIVIGVGANCNRCVSDYSSLLYIIEQSYQLTYRVFDDKHTNTTTVIINVADVNDNPGNTPAL